MKRELLACLVSASVLIVAAAPPPDTHDKTDVPFNQVTTTPNENCDETSGIVMKLEKGGSITGPFTITETTGLFRYPDGSLRASTEDDIRVTVGQTLTGPITICSRINKP
jgi:hypothetical protein